MKTLALSVSCLCAILIIAPSAVTAQDVPLGLKSLKKVKDNPQTDAKIELGKQLYFDKRLSSDNTVSCASCHDPKKGWSNGEPNAEGVDGQRGDRNSPTIINTAYQRFQFWDGRAGSLEEQALGPIANPIEMNLSIEDAVKRVAAIEGYAKQFKAIFGGPVTDERIAKAIAAFERTVLSGNAPYDRFKAGDENALSEKAELGRKLFFGKANCSSCHSGSNFTDNAFHNIGVGVTAEKQDVGREKISGLSGDRGAFKTPTLRDIHRTGPYMHDGSMSTLEEIVEHYAKGGVANDQLDEEIFKLKLSDEDKQALVIFMKEGLASDDYPDTEEPELP